MNCPTCGLAMHRVAEHTWHCARCGTLVSASACAVPPIRPALVDRARELHEAMKGSDDWSHPPVDTMRQLGIFEAIYLPGDRPAG